MWLAGKLLKVKVDGDRYEDRNVGDPVPEAVRWPSRQFEAHKDLGWIYWVDLETKHKKKTKQKRKRLTLQKEV